MGRLGPSSNEPGNEERMGSHAQRPSPGPERRDRPSVSIVVPTRNEAPNIEPLLDGLDHAFAGTAFEVVFVDDSDDDTVPRIRHETEARETPVQLIHRGPGARRGGLGTAVVEGFHAAKAPWAIVMDADLQHPPSASRALLRCAQNHSVDVVIGSRFEADGASSGLGSARFVMSRTAHGIAKAMFPVRLGPVSDPLSGLFAVRLDAVDLTDLAPDGFKILMELLLANPTLRIAEVGYGFQQRHAGESKASTGEMVRYLGLLARRRMQPSPPRVVRLPSTGLRAPETIVLS